VRSAIGGYLRVIRGCDRRAVKAGLAGFSSHGFRSPATSEVLDKQGMGSLSLAMSRRAAFVRPGRSARHAGRLNVARWGQEESVQQNDVLSMTVPGSERDGRGGKPGSKDSRRLSR
jgi:hypothetical protein